MKTTKLQNKKDCSVSYSIQHTKQATRTTQDIQNQNHTHTRTHAKVTLYLIHKKYQQRKTVSPVYLTVGQEVAVRYFIAETC